MELSPREAAQLANAVYGIKDQSNVADALVLRGESSLLASGFYDFGKAAVIQGSSGAGVRKTSGFSIVLPCTGARQGEYIVLTRGTVSSFDWLSNFTSAVEAGPGGHLVHAGFNRVATSVMGDVFGALRNKNPSALHCVGHSLGGAISNILAAQLSARVGMAELYTFGAPRAGLDTFCEALSWSLGHAHINRCYSLQDVVPMVPIYPFFHAPQKLRGALCGETTGLLSINAHFMTAYGPSVANASWDSLVQRAQGTPLSTEELLTLASRQTKIPGMGIALHTLGRVLGLLLEKSNQVTGARVTGSLTVLDRMAMMLTSGQRASPELDDQVKRFIRCVLGYAGLPLQTGVLLGVVFVNYVLGLLIRPLLSQATVALSQLGKGSC